MSSNSFYVERPAAADLAGYIQCVWYRRVGEEDAVRPRRVLPDGCMDLIWMGGRLVVAGPDTRAQIPQLPPGEDVVAIRFRPGAATPVLGVPAVELIDERVAAADIWGRSARDVTARLEAVRRTEDVADVLQDTVRRRLSPASELDRVVRQLVLSVQQTGGDPTLRVDWLADQLGISERQLRRRCSLALGYGPKTFARIVRFQRFLEDARGTQPRALCELAAHNGYADQAHLSREVRRLSGMSPTALIADLGH
jgi:AraC-like DNA-binding protein